MPPGSRDRDDRALKPTDRIPLPEEQRRFIEESILPPEDVPEVTRKPSSYPGEEQDALRDVRNDPDYR